VPAISRGREGQKLRGQLDSLAVSTLKTVRACQTYIVAAININIINIMNISNITNKMDALM